MCSGFMVLSTPKGERDVTKGRNISSQLQQFNFKSCINILRCFITCFKISNYKGFFNRSFTSLEGMKSHLRSGKDFPLFIGGAQVVQHVTSAGIYSAKHLLVQVLKKLVSGTSIWNTELIFEILKSACKHIYNYNLTNKPHYLRQIVLQLFLLASEQIWWGINSFCPIN